MADIVFVNETEKLELRQETNGTLLLATKLLQAGIDTRVLRFGQMEYYNRDYAAFIREMTHKILAMSAKCVAFYTLWPYYHIVLRIARCLKEADSDIAIILGGPQASATAQATMEAMEFVDYICTGEGEDTIVPFVQALLRKDTGALARIPGLYYRSQGAVCHCEEQIPLCDLNSLPHWDDHAVVTGVVDGVGSGVDRDLCLRGNGLYTQTAGDDHHILRACGDHVGQTLLGLGLVTQKIGLGGTHHGLTQALSQLYELLQLRFLHGFIGFVALVAGHDEQIVLTFQQGSQLFVRLQRILGVIFQLLTFLTDYYEDSLDSC